MRAVKGLGVAVAAAVLVSCGSSSSGAGGRPAVLDAYRQSWYDLIAAGDPIKPEAPELRTHRSGQALDVIVAVLQEYEAKGVVYRGSVELHPKIVEFNSEKAEIRDCVFDHTETLEPMTNQIVKAAADHPRWVNTTMQVVDGAWKAVNFVPEDQECTPEP
jgi:hypothetical protein